MGPSDGRSQLLSFSIFKAIFRSRSRSRVSRETLEPSPVLPKRFVKGASFAAFPRKTRRRALLWYENDKIKSPTHHKNVGNLISDFPVVINQRRRARAAGDERGHFRFVVFQQRRERCRCHDDARLSLSLSFYDRKETILDSSQRSEKRGRSIKVLQQKGRRSPLVLLRPKAEP